MPDNDAADVEIYQRVTRLEVRANHTDARIATITSTLEGLARGLKWLTVVLAVLTALTMGERVLPLLSLLAGR